MVHTAEHGLSRRAIRINRWSLSVFALVALGALGAAPPARALPLQDTASNVADALHNILDLRPSDTTDWRLGVGPVINPKFEGSRAYTIQPAPMISVRYRDVLKVDNNQIDFTAFDQVFDLGEGVGKLKLDAGPVMNLDFGRHASDSPALKGLGNIGVAVELGGYVSVRVGRVKFDAEMSQDIADGHHGADLDLHSSLVLYRNDKLTIAPDIVLTWATARYMKSFFGITQTQSNASGLPVFRAGSGFKNATLSLLGNYDLSAHWSLLANIGYKRLLGDAAASPLIKLRGSADQWTGGTYIVYAF
ncbi:MAG: MipA/OmpV family protein [Rhodospirillaceae bacterium]|nr:MAG: MipA/OmpV family protein [Rhodospirillaceae bacterium]